MLSIQTKKAVLELYLPDYVIWTLVGLSLLYTKQNSAGVVTLILGIVVITVGLMVGYVFIERKYRKV